jgi:molybdopterin-guanine dinucleotide biosynthesis protein A
MKVGGIVLCGGRSQRMGKSKAWLPVGREYLLQRVVRVVVSRVDPVVVAARPGQELPRLPDGVDVAYDAVVDRGPLVGLAAGFSALPADCAAAFVVSCDHPLLKPAFIGRLLELLGNRAGVVPVHQERWYPLTAVYRLGTRTILDEMLTGEDLRVREFARRCHPRFVTADDLTHVDPDLDSLRNVNDPDDYDRVIEMLER